MSSAYIDYIKSKNKCCKTIPEPQGIQGTAVNTGLQVLLAD